MRLITDITANGQTVDITVNEDTDSDGTAENTETVTGIGGGTTETDLTSIDYTDGNEYWVDVTLNATATNAPEVNSVQLKADAPSLSVDATGSDSVDLSWTNPNSVSSFDLYKAQSSGSSTSDYTKIADPSSTSYTDSGLEDGEQYFYRVADDGSSDLSNEVSPTTTLPAPSGLSLDASVEDEISLSWTNNDDSSDGTIEVLRSTDGSTGTSVASFNTLTTTSYTDTGLEDGEQYHYSIRRSTDHVNSDSSQQNAVTILPGPSGITVGTVSDGSIDLSWTRNDDSSDGTWEILLSEDGSTGTSTKSISTVTTTSTTVSGLENGEQYYFTVQRATDHTTTNGSQVTATTTLPQTRFTLDDSVEDELTLNWTKADNSSDGNWKIYRSQDGTKGKNIATISNLSTSSYTDTGLEDGEQYHYTLERNTDHVTNSYQDSAITKLPQPTISFNNSIEDEITIDWTKEDDSSDGVWRLFRSQDGTKGTKILDTGTLSTTSYTDGSLEDGELYYYTIERVTNHNASSVQGQSLTKLPGPTNLSLDPGDEEIQLDWFNNDDSSDGTIEILRSQDGTTGTSVATITNLSTTSYTDTGLEDGEKYYYTVRRSTGHATTDSSQESSVTVPDPVSNLTGSTGTVVTELDLSWTKEDNSTDGSIEVYRSQDKNNVGSLLASLAYNATSYTDTTVSAGTEYYYTVRRITDHSSVDTTEQITSGGVVGDKEVIRWDSKGDWGESQSNNGIAFEAYDGYSSEQIRRGIPKDADGLLALYTFESSDGTLIDRVNGYDGTVINGNSITYNQNGLNDTSAWYFDGSSDSRVELPNMGKFGNTPLSYVVNVKPRDTSEQKCIVHIGGDDAYEAIILAVDDTCDNITVAYGQNSVQEISITNISNTWVQLALTYNPSNRTFEVYLDGTSQGTHTPTEDIRVHNSRYNIGSEHFARSGVDSLRPLDADLSEVAIFEKTLSGTEVSNIYKSLTTGSITTKERKV